MLIERGNCLGGLAVQAGIDAFNGIYTCGENPQKCAAGVADQILEESGVYCDVPPASWYDIRLNALRSADPENL